MDEQDKDHHRSFSAYPIRFCAKYRRNAADTPHIHTLISPIFPFAILINVCITNPAPIPTVMLYVSGIKIIANRAGKPSSISVKSIFLTSYAIRNPTRIRTGAVACEGMTAAKGDKKIDSRNNIPTTTDVRPVLPPSATPAELSI